VVSPDPRFGMLAPVTQSYSTKTPSGTTSTNTASRTVVLTDSSNPLSIQTVTETSALNGKSTSRVYNASQRTWTATSPVGRTTTSVIDTAGRTTRSQLPLVLPIDMSYDSHGRLRSTLQGTRSQLFAYDGTTGYLSGVTDPLSQTVTYQRDAVGRTTLQTLADQNVVQFGYDNAGNMIWLTPPAKPTHNFDYTPVNLLADYTPPVVAGAGAILTHYDYDIDQNLASLLRPDGATIALGYDAAGG